MALIESSRPVCLTRVSARLQQKARPARDADARVLLAHADKAQPSILRDRLQQSGAGDNVRHRQHKLDTAILDRGDNAAAVQRVGGTNGLSATPIPSFSGAGSAADRRGGRAFCRKMLRTCSCGRVSTVHSIKLPFDDVCGSSAAHAKQPTTSSAGSAPRRLGDWVAHGVLDRRT
jgi:hypothetical protein